VAKRTVRFRARAAADVDAAVDYYRDDVGEAVALEFVDAVEQCVRRIRSSPQLGSLRFSYEVDIPELRVVATQRFPYLIFYIPSVDTIDIWRVRHSRRDLPATLTDPG
jgi:toxin ParE1/3/4